MLPLNLFTAIALLATAVTAIPLPAQQQTTSILTFPLLDRSIPPTSPSITALQKRAGGANRQAIFDALHALGTKVLPAKWVPPHRQLVPGVHTTTVGKKLSSFKATIKSKLGMPEREPVVAPGWGPSVKGSTSNPPSPPPLRVQIPKKFDSPQKVDSPQRVDSPQKVDSPQRVDSPKKSEIEEVPVKAKPE
ncbi:hypothetical protein HYALB_00000985 [Hymenoscyphus albidus]|uniref:Uncharacterized protein n=1 Tax=Hymenoscyphus albidus TaxID=595503 RepID=A0A9N9M239_9HELO|nr:hypothetical protein HYALB_00000985 [Hymenoscyphus albidus]